MINACMPKYITERDLYLKQLEVRIEIAKKVFRMTDWTDEKLMVKAAMEIYSLEDELKSTKEVDKIIMENVGTSE